MRNNKSCFIKKSVIVTIWFIKVKSIILCVVREIHRSPPRK